jgi:hypothetical protein
MDMIKKYASGTPKPYAVAVTKKIASEGEAAKFVTSCGDKKAVANKVEGGYSVHYRRWFDDLQTAQAFVTTMQKKQEEKKAEAELQSKCATLKTELQTMVSLMESRGKTDLVEKTKALIAKL